MKEYPRKMIIDKMFEAALKEKFSELLRKYDPRLVFEIWAEILKSGGVQGLISNGAWDQNMTIEGAIDSLDDYCNMIESTISKRQEEKKERKAELSHQKTAV